MHGFTEGYTERDLAVAGSFVTGQFGGWRGGVNAEEIPAARGGSEVAATQPDLLVDAAAEGGMVVAFAFARWILTWRHWRVSVRT